MIRAFFGGVIGVIRFIGFIEFIGFLGFTVLSIGFLVGVLSWGS